MNCSNCGRKEGQQHEQHQSIAIMSILVTGRTLLVMMVIGFGLVGSRKIDKPFSCASTGLCVVRRWLMGTRVAEAQSIGE